MDAEFLETMIKKGAEKYQSGRVDHLSAEEVLQQGTFDLQLKGEIRQGLLSHDTHHGMGLLATLSSCKSKPSCILITKTPETVLIIIENDRYILIDSHPRPQLGADQAYAQFYSSLKDLVGGLQLIFPVTDLGSDVPELMSQMYNTFDCYELEKKD